MIGRTGFSKDFKKRLTDRYGPKCLICGTEYDPRYLQPDHRAPQRIASKNLGANKRAQTHTVTALLAGAVFAGTSERKLSFGEINRVCDAKHCFDSGNAASSIKATPGYSSLGGGKTQAIVTRSGWQDEFAKASRRVLGKPEPKS